MELFSPLLSYMYQCEAAFSAYTPPLTMYCDRLDVEQIQESTYLLFKSGIKGICRTENSAFVFTKFFV